MVYASTYWQALLYPLSRLHVGHPLALSQRNHSAHQREFLTTWISFFGTHGQYGVRTRNMYTYTRKQKAADRERVTREVWRIATIKRYDTSTRSEETRSGRNTRNSNRGVFVSLCMRGMRLYQYAARVRVCFLGSPMVLSVSNNERLTYFSLSVKACKFRNFVIQLWFH